MALVRRDISTLNKLHTVEGQLALVLAAHVSAAGSSASAISSELRLVLSHMGVRRPRPDEVAALRRRRDAKARAAARRKGKL